MRVRLVFLATAFACGSAEAQSWPPATRLPYGPSTGVAAAGAVAPSGAGSCGAAPATKSAPSDDTPPDQTIAIVAGERIVYGSIRQKVGMQLARSKADYLRKRRDLEGETLKQLVEDRLLAREAERRKTTVDSLVQAEVEAKLGEPSDAELKAMYERFKERIGAPFDDVKAQLGTVVKARKRKTLREGFLGRLRAEAGVQEMLPEVVMPVIEIPEDGAPSMGPASAPIKVVVFSDFECPFCSRVVPTLHQLMKKYEGRIRVAFRDFPLSFHENAQRASEGAHCAHVQGKFWPYHDRLFANQDKLQEKDLIEHAKALGLDAAGFEACLKSGRFKDKVQQNLRAGESFGVNGTPAIFINGTLLSGAQPLEAMVPIVDSFLKSAGGGR